MIQMKIKEGFVVREIADSIVVVPTGDLLKEYRGMLTLNKSGQFIWELLKNDVTEEELATKLAEKYHLEHEKAKTDIDAFLHTLREKKILENDL